MIILTITTQNAGVIAGFHPQPSQLFGAAKIMHSAVTIPIKRTIHPKRIRERLVILGVMGMNSYF